MAGKQVIAGPEEIERFARELQQFSTSVTALNQQLKSRFSQLGDTWKDQEYQKLSQELVTLSKSLDHFAKSSEQHVPVLRKKAAALRAFLNQR